MNIITCVKRKEKNKYNKKIIKWRTDLAFIEKRKEKKKKNMHLLSNTNYFWVIFFSDFVDDCDRLPDSGPLSITANGDGELSSPQPMPNTSVIVVA